MRIVDSHCHLEEGVFADDLPGLVERMCAAQVAGVVSVGVSPERWVQQVSVAGQVRPLGMPVGLAFGIHPWWADRVDGDAGLQALDQWLDAHRADRVAIGEIGLDCAAGMPALQRQQNLFHGQLDRALRWDLPVILHERKSADLLLKAIRQRPALRGVVHGFVGSAQQAQQLIERGFYLGVGGAITHPRATRLRRVVAGLPLTSLLLETDAPNQPGHAHLGERNEPAFIREPLTVLAALFGQEEAVVAEQLYRNTLALLGSAWLELP
jgi:TatD DNase family protein